MKNIVYIVLSVMALCACRKGDTNNIQPEHEDNRLTTVKVLNSNGHLVYINKTYDEQKRLISEESFDEQTLITLKELFHYKDQRLDYSTIQNSSRLIAKTNYLYTNDQLTKMQYLEYGLQGELSLNFEKTFEYKDGLIYKIAIIPSGGVVSSYQLFTFINKNLTEIRMYTAENTLKNKFNFEYDDKHNPFHYITETNQSTEGYSVNNAVSMTSTDYTSNQTNRNAYRYEYNDKGFPTKKSLITSGSENVFQASYHYSFNH